MSRDIHDYDSLKEAYDVLLMFERFPGPVRSERVEEFVTQLKRDIREYVNRVSDCHIVRDELDSFVELVKLPEKLSPLSKESVLEWFYMHRAYRDDRYDGMAFSAAKEAFNLSQNERIVVELAANFYNAGLFCMPGFEMVCATCDTAFALILEAFRLRRAKLFYKDGEVSAEWEERK